ncbi:hypothetical protein BGX23_007968 [Mortierella sp. AD031]|nr:hypothetical protein BGX23_007968 [Mortierella sp. AD031]
MATAEKVTEHKFKNSEWGLETSDPMIKKVKVFLIPFGGTLGDFIDVISRDTISRELLLSAGLGAMTARKDAVVLANSLYETKGLSPAEINEALDSFKEERYTRVKDQFLESKTGVKLLYGQVSVLGIAPALPQKVTERYQREQAALKVEGVVDSAGVIV